MYNIGHIPVKKHCSYNGVRHFVFSIITRGATSYLKVYHPEDGAENIAIGVNDIIEWEE